MTNTVELRKRITKSGLKYQFLADKIGITRAALYQKINNISVFRIDEVAKLCDLLGIRTLTERDRIFFAKEMGDFRENCIEWITGDKQATLSITNPKHVNLLRRFIEKGEKEIEIVAENPDGSICAHVPVSWISIRKPVKLNLTAEQREERRRRFRENVG